MKQQFKLTDKQFARLNQLCYPGKWNYLFNIAFSSPAIGRETARIADELGIVWDSVHFQRDQRSFTATLQEPIRLCRDGNQWCATETATFVNLQESPAGFGDTKEEAIADLDSARKGE